MSSLAYRKFQHLLRSYKIINIGYCNYGHDRTTIPLIQNGGEKLFTCEVNSKTIPKEE